MSETSAGTPIPAQTVPWSPLDEYLWYSCEIIADLVEGRLEQRALIASTARLQHGERVLAVGPAQRGSWRALGDGSYMHQSGFAFGNPGFVLTSLAATAISNSARRNRAARDAQPRWVLEGPGEVTVTTRRMHFSHPVHELYWDWDASGLRAIDLIAPDAVEVAFIDNNNTHNLARVHTSWASLIFALTARTSFPAHPRLLTQGWLPPDFDKRCALIGRPCHPAARLLLGRGIT
ncbi:hypothetical protein AB0G83_25355 [Streptomyces klenkii]|uniref:hypothetical protein n=1 Tax=Streptomyces klenkii TaxID=1420899 RepID=UPI00340F3D25